MRKTCDVYICSFRARSRHGQTSHYNVKHYNIEALIFINKLETNKRRL